MSATLTNPAPPAVHHADLLRLPTGFNAAPLMSTRIGLGLGTTAGLGGLPGGQTLTFTNTRGETSTATITTTRDRALAFLATTARPSVRQVFTVTKTGDQTVTTITTPPTDMDLKVDATGVESGDGASTTLTTAVGECRGVRSSTDSYGKAGCGVLFVKFQSPVTRHFHRPPPGALFTRLDKQLRVLPTTLGAAAKPDSKTLGLLTFKPGGESLCLCIMTISRSIKVV